MHTFNFITKRLPYLQQDLPIIDGTQHIGERTIEIPIAKEYIAAHDTDERFLEIGAVTPYFRKALGGEPTWPVYDLYDSWGRCVRMDAEDLTYTDANVLSISTIEHMGMLEYGNTEEDKVKAAQVFQKITTQARSFAGAQPAITTSASGTSVQGRSATSMVPRGVACLGAAVHRLR